jgi:hypothetical protein
MEDRQGHSLKFKKRAMKKIPIIAVILAALVWSCNLSDTDVVTKKVTYNYTKAAGEYAVNFELTDGDEASGTGHFKIYNTSFSKDSLWIEDTEFWGSQIKVKFNETDNTFSVTNGANILSHSGEVGTITGQVFREQDSVQVEWRYPDVDDPSITYVVTAQGKLYNGETN